MPRIPMPPGPDPLARKYEECLEFGDEFGMDFKEDGEIRTRDHNFFTPGPFPTGSFFKGDKLYGYKARANDTKIEFNFIRARDKADFHVTLYVKSECVESTKK